MAIVFESRSTKYLGSTIDIFNVEFNLNNDHMGLLQQTILHLSVNSLNLLLPMLLIPHLGVFVLISNLFMRVQMPFVSYRHPL